MTIRQSEFLPEPAGDDIENPIVMKLSDDECSHIIKSLRSLLVSVAYLRAQDDEKNQSLNHDYLTQEMADTAALITRFVEATGGKHSLIDTWGKVDK